MLLIPLDNRPVSYDLPQQIAKVGGVNLAIPPKDVLGGLTYQADFNALREWTSQIIKSKRISTAVVALDTIAYGGLVPSRWSEDYYEDIINRINTFLQLFKTYNVTVHAYSSIMRISNNNYNEEEKEYWSEFGTLIFKYSNLFHKVRKLNSPILEEDLNKVIQEIPQEILEDYVSSRERNFAVNQFYLEKLKQDMMESLLFCQDDTSKWGINVIEADTLKNLVNQYKLQNKVQVHTGSDEVASTLLVKAAMWPHSLSVYPIYSQEAGKEMIAHYEDKPVKKSVEGQIKIVGAKKSSSIGSADLILLIHLSELEQGDHIFNLEPEGVTEDALSKCAGLLQSLDKPIAVADIVWANGADPDLVKRIISTSVDLKNLYGYAAWNTASNTIGSVLAMGLMKLFAEKNNTVNSYAFKKLLFTRLMDDWAYQAEVRQSLREPDATELNKRMKEKAKPLLKKFDITGDVSFTFPWERLFELEINFH